MKEAFILAFIPLRMKQLGYETYHLRYRDIYLEANATLDLEAHNELYFVIGEPQDLTIDSIYGYYDTTSSGVTENSFQHRGQIIISNMSDTAKRIKFIQVIIVN
jgi:hypothetical protein